MNLEQTLEPQWGEKKTHLINRLKIMHHLQIYKKLKMNTKILTQRRHLNAALPS